MPPQVFEAAPVKVMATPAVWLKLIVPLLARLPPMDRVCVAAAAPAWKVPPTETVALPPSVNERAVVGSYCKTPETP